MREILFKAKRIDNGEWVEGFYFKTPLTEESVWGAKCENGLYFCCGIEAQHCISNSNGATFSVDPNTVCQYTGLKNKNGNKIFENDIVRTIYDYDFTDDKPNILEEVVEDIRDIRDMYYWIDEVIGNVWDGDKNDET